jgi:hypothetical protein
LRSAEKASPEDQGADGSPTAPDQSCRPITHARNLWPNFRQAALVAELHEMVEGEDPDVFYLEQFLPPEDAAQGAS